MSTGPAGGGYHTSEDEQILHRMGYAQEVFRAMGGFQNFAISFTIISILAGCLTSYYIAFNNGGPDTLSLRAVRCCALGPRIERVGLCARRTDEHDRGARDGGDRVGVPDRGRSVLLVVQARERGVGLVHR